ncbi:SH3 domain-containing protein [Tepidamorphus sp. 3E244]|uniref:SH3 domain-containing protein n=1 Tax=Tepidamorphus sp. 3E244 TaxID=3385498 RepID=UPI0038FC08C0
MRDAIALKPGQRQQTGGIWRLAVLAGVVVLSTGIAAALFASRDPSPRVTGSVDAGALPAAPLGPSGLPLPRYVSLKSSRVNVRIGPSQDHAVSWVFHSAGLPVEIVAEYGNWRRIRDSEGSEGWVYHSLLSGRRTALVSPWQGGEGDKAETIRNSPDEESRVIARVEKGAIVSVRSCDDSWCEVAASGVNGYMPQPLLWGVYPRERIDD